MKNYTKPFLSGFLALVFVFGNCRAMENRRTACKTTGLIISSSITLGSLAALNSCGTCSYGDFFRTVALGSSTYSILFALCGHDRLCNFSGKLWKLAGGIPNQEDHDEDFMTTDRIAAIRRLEQIKTLDYQIFLRISGEDDLRIQAYKTSDLLKLKDLDEQTRALVREQHDLETQKDRLINESMVVMDDICSNDI